MNNDEDEKYQKARIRVRKVRQFYTSVITYILVNILLLVINLILSPKELWFYWVSLIWGVVLIVQAFNTFTIRDKFLGDEWEERKIQKHIDKEKKKK